MQYALNYSGTRFLPTENQNYSMSWYGGLRLKLGKENVCFD